MTTNNCQKGGGNKMRVIETRKVDSLGRIVLPIELRKEFDIGERSAVDICMDDNQIIIRKNEPSCKICRATENLKQVQDKNIFVCTNCQKKVCNL